MNSIELLEAVNKAPKIKFCDVEAETAKLKGGGVYVVEEKEIPRYVGDTPNFKKRVGKDHTSGNCVKSTFVQYYRQQRFLSVTREDADKYPDLPLPVIEENKINENATADVKFILIPCNPKELLEDVKQKPEKFLKEYFRETIWNDPKSSKSKK